MKTKLILFGLLFGVMCWTSLSYAGVPQMINYQGKITTPAGALVDTTVQMTFTIYDDSTTGTVLWADTQSTVVVEKGIFSVLLGSVNPIPDSVFPGEVRYLGVQVGADPEMIPRKSIVSVGYAYKSEYADTAQYAQVAVSDGDWTPDTAGINIYRLTGNVGIGTATPNEKLHVNNEWGNGVSVFTLGTGVVSYPTEAAIAIGTAYNNRHGLAIRTSNNVIGSTSHASLWIENTGMGGHTFYAADESGDATPFVITNDGKVGVGTTAPDEELHVQGNIKMVDGNQAAGKVLTSDASGVGTWQAATGGDIDWTFRITDTADTTLMMGGQWGIARSGNILYGNADSTHVNLGIACTTGIIGQNKKYCTAGGGIGNIASGDYSTTSGGVKNTASGNESTVGGGNYNTASGLQATVAGGYAGNASGESSTIGGGWHNTASGIVATVAGGQENTASHHYATVGGGYQNTASGERTTVGGGGANTASGYAATVPGGFYNLAAGDYSLAAGAQIVISSDADYTFAFGRNFTTSTANAVIFYDATSEMKVGIQTTSPTNILTVKQNSATDPIADAWTTYSSREYKTDIHELTPEEYREALKKVISVPVVKFHYRGEDTKEKIGLIAEDAPAEILAEGDNKAISLNEYISLLHAALKAQQEELEALRTKIENLESNR